MRTGTIFAACAVLGALLLVFVSESNWLMAAVLGVALGLSLALFFYVYPTDIAAPSDRRHEAAQRKRDLRV
jgi:hypothetical protein